MADFYIDPWLPVPKAIITHAHSDHAKAGCQHYLSHHDSEPILRLRLGQDIHLETLHYGQQVAVNGVRISLHPAGHIIGSAQVRLEYRGEIWVVSGDYKVEDDRLSGSFEPVRCHTFITECTFGLPIFKWRPQQEIYDEVNQWWRSNAAEGKTSVLLGYPLGKSQRLLHHLDQGTGKILAHGSVWNTNDAFRQKGITLPSVERVTPETDKSVFKGSLVLAPPSALGTPWIKKFKPYSIGNASGWMNLRGIKRRKPIDRGFVLSDHADWDGLISAVKATGATRIFATHGYKSTFSKYLKDQGYEAYEADTLWEGETAEEKGEAGEPAK